MQTCLHQVVPASRSSEGRGWEKTGDIWGWGECYKAKCQMTAEFGFWQKSTFGTDPEQEDQVPSTKARLRV